MESLENKTAVVTGAGSGMGRAFAERFARAGMNVVLADVEEPVLDEAVKAVAELGPGALGVPTDVSDRQAVDALRDEAIENFGSVHVVCNNAGVAGGSDTIEDWQWVMNVNFWGVVHGIRAFLPLLQEQGEGHIVNTASVAGLFPGYSPYSASKWAVVGISEGLFNQLRMEQSDVGVTCLCPGWVRTGIVDSDRNRPEWARQSALEAPEPDQLTQMRMQFAREAVASGMPPEQVADMIHDAVIDQRFWVFTDLDMIEAQRPRLDALLSGTNPPVPDFFGD